LVFLSPWSISWSLISTGRVDCTARLALGVSMVDLMEPDLDLVEAADRTSPISVSMVDLMEPDLDRLAYTDRRTRSGSVSMVDLMEPDLDAPGLPPRGRR